MREVTASYTFDKITLILTTVVVSTQPCTQRRLASSASTFTVSLASAFCLLGKHWCRWYRYPKAAKERHCTPSSDGAESRVLSPMLVMCQCCWRHACEGLSQPMLRISQVRFTSKLHVHKFCFSPCHTQIQQRHYICLPVSLSVMQ